MSLHLTYKFSIGADIAFATGQGVKRGIIRVVHCNLSSEGSKVTYVVHVRSKGDAGKGHTEQVDEGMCSATLDGAWLLHEKLVP